MELKNPGNYEEHYINALGKVGVELKTHNIYVVHLLSENEPPFMTRNRDAVVVLLKEYGDSMVINMNPCHEVDNVVYIGDSLKTYTNTFTPLCTVTNEERGI